MLAPPSLLTSSTSYKGFFSIFLVDEQEYSNAITNIEIIFLLIWNC